MSHEAFSSRTLRPPPGPTCCSFTNTRTSGNLSRIMSANSSFPSSTWTRISLGTGSHARIVSMVRSVAAGRSYAVTRADTSQGVRSRMDPRCSSVLLLLRREVDLPMKRSTGRRRYTGRGPGPWRLGRKRPMPGADAERDELARLYLDLMKRSLTNTIYDDPDLVPVAPRRSARRVVVSAFADAGILLVRERSHEWRASGRQPNPRAHTMIGIKRLDNIQRCVESVLADGVPGDLLEAGVWRGGASCFMRGTLKAHGVGDRRVWLADSFRGLPPPDAQKYPRDEGDRPYTIPWLAVAVQPEKTNLWPAGVLDCPVH